jgi:hypothetical protein
LRHTIPPHDKNLGRWPTSPFWLAVQKADFFGEGTPAIRERKNQGNLKLICQMLAGCSTTAAAYLAGALPEEDDGANFPSWFYDWMVAYLQGKSTTFETATRDKRIKLGISDVGFTPAA